MKKFNNYIITLIWFTNSLVCEVLNLLSKDHKIVRPILEWDYFGNLIFFVGVLEAVVGFWILSKIQPKVHAVIQVALITGINVFEFFFAPELLLWSQFNAFFVLLFVLFIYLNKSSHFKLTTLEN